MSNSYEISSLSLICRVLSMSIVLGGCGLFPSPKRNHRHVVEEVSSSNPSREPGNQSTHEPAAEPAPATSSGGLPAAGAPAITAPAPAVVPAPQYQQSDVMGFWLFEGLSLDGRLVRPGEIVSGSQKVAAGKEVLMFGNEGFARFSQNSPVSAPLASFMVAGTTIAVHESNPDALGVRYSGMSKTIAAVSTDEQGKKHLEINAPGFTSVAAVTGVSSTRESYVYLTREEADALLKEDLRYRKVMNLGALVDKMELKGFWALRAVVQRSGVKLAVDTPEAQSALPNGTLYKRFIVLADGSRQELWSTDMAALKLQLAEREEIFPKRKSYWQTVQDFQLRDDGLLTVMSKDTSDLTVVETPEGNPLLLGLDVDVVSIGMTIHLETPETGKELWVKRPLEQVLVQNAAGRTSIAGELPTDILYEVYAPISSKEIITEVETAAAASSADSAQ